MESHQIAIVAAVVPYPIAQFFAFSPTVVALLWSGSSGMFAGRSETMADTGLKSKDRVSKPSPVQRRYLERGLGEPGGKLPLFDRDGQRVKDQTIKACMSKGWCEPWYNNPLKPDWLVCKITEDGIRAIK